MEATSFFPSQKENKKINDYLLEFRQLKGYFNFHRKFKANKADERIIGKVFQNDYYLIDKNWLNKWKEYVGYNDIIKLNLNRDINDNDYDLFKKFLPKNIKEIRLFPLDNSNIYLNNGEINPFSEFIIINKECHNIFGESRKNMNYIYKERSVPLKFLKNKIILTTNGNTRIIYFKNENNVDEEIIIIFLKNDYKSMILKEIEKAENFQYWLKDKSFDLDFLDELEIEEFGYKIINKKLKLKSKMNFNEVNPNTIVSNTTLIGFKYNFPDNLKNPQNFDIQKPFNNNYNNNGNLIVENKKLKDELNTFKTKNEELKNTINILNNENVKLKNELTNANKIIFNINNNPNNQHDNNKMIKHLNDLIIMKDDLINDLKLKLQNNNQKDKLVNYDNILFVHFISLDQKINCGIKCLKTDTFAEVEEKLYQKYEEYRETNNNFVTKGRTVLRFKKIFENNIQDGDKIELIKIE